MSDRLCTLAGFTLGLLLAIAALFFVTGWDYVDPDSHAR